MPQQIKPDQQAASEFLCQLDSSADAFTFQLFYDPDPGNSPPIPQKTIHTDLLNGWEFLTTANRKKFGVFVTINATDGFGRKKENIRAIRAVFQEDDEGFGEATLPLAPSMVVESSPGKFHRYFLLDQPYEEDLTIFEQLQKRLIASYGSDKSCKDLPRVLRVPGFFHWKNPVAPHLVSCKSVSDERYTIEELCAAFPPVEIVAPAAPSATANGDLSELTQLLVQLEPDLPYEDWLATGMALHFETEGSDAGLALWDQWSSGFFHGGSSSKYKPNDCSSRWHDFTVDREQPIAIGTLRKLVNDNTPRINLLDTTTPQPLPGGNGLFAAFKIEEAFVNTIGEENWAYQNLLIEGQITTLIGRSGSGKTTLLYYIVAPALAQAGYKVYYIDADSPITEYKRMFACAQEHCFTFMSPDLNAGTSVEALRAEMASLATNNRSLEKHVFVFDTMKKFTDLMSKDKVKEFFKLLRKMSRLGATIVLPGHANKHLGPDGQLIYEGTGDVMADGDNLIFLHERHDGNITTTTTVVDKNYGAKTRGIFAPIAFRIDTENRTVELTDANLVGPWAQSNNGDRRRSSITEETIIEAAINYIREIGAEQPVRFSDLWENVKARTGAGRDRVQNIITKHSVQKGMQINEEVNNIERYFEYELGGETNRTKTYFLTEIGRNWQGNFDE